MTSKRNPWTPAEVRLLAKLVKMNFKLSLICERLGHKHSGYRVAYKIKQLGLKP